jgi:hypothetical protein
MLRARTNEAYMKRRIDIIIHKAENFWYDETYSPLIYPRLELEKDLLELNDYDIYLEFCSAEFRTQ